MFRRIWWAWLRTSPSISLPVAGSWATCPLRNSSPPPRTPSENGPTAAGSLSLVMASRVIVNGSFLSVQGAVERGTDDVEAFLEPVRRLVGEAEPEHMGGVAEPGARGDDGPLPGKAGVEAVNVLGPEGVRVKLHAAECPGLGRQPVQPAGVSLDPAFDDIAALGKKRAARGENLVRARQQPGGEELVDGPARQRGIELRQPQLLGQGRVTG